MSFLPEKHGNFGGGFGDPETHGPLVWRGIGGPSGGRRTGRGIGCLPASTGPPMGGAGADSAGGYGFPGRLETIAFPAGPGTFGTCDRGSSGRWRPPAPGPPDMRTDPSCLPPGGGVAAARGSKRACLRAPAAPGDKGATRPDASHPAVRHRGPVADGRPAARGSAPGRAHGRQTIPTPGPGGRGHSRFQRRRGGDLSPEGTDRRQGNTFRPGKRHARPRDRGRPGVCVGPPDAGGARR